MKARQIITLLMLALVAVGASSQMSVRRKTPATTEEAAKKAARNNGTRSNDAASKAPAQPAVTQPAAQQSQSTAVIRKNADKDKQKRSDEISDRQQDFFEVTEPSDADLEWMKIVYRQIDLTKGKNGALYYPEEPNADGQNLFFIIMHLLADGKISAYEYLDGKEMFEDKYKIKVGEMLDRFHVLYTEAKGSTEKNPKYTIEDADIPSNEVLSYYIIEKWEFDTRSNQMKQRVVALCPVLHRTDEYGGEAIKYPMFWVKLNDIRPYIARQYVFTDDDNNLPRYSLDDFFKLNMYTGDIYKTKNMRNLSLMQQFPDSVAFKHAQDSIENRLRMFNKNLWVPTREELQARAEAQAKLEAESDSTDAGDDEATESKPANKRSVTNKRSSRNSSSKSKAKTTKVKTRQPKASSSSRSSSAVRSVRRRK